MIGLDTASPLKKITAIDEAEKNGGPGYYEDKLIPLLKKQDVCRVVIEACGASTSLDTHVSGNSELSIDADGTPHLKHWRQ